MPEESRIERPPVSHRWVWIGLIALAIVVLSVFVIGYWVFVSYERKVAGHIPPSTVAVVRVNVEQVVLYEPVRKHLFPVLDGVVNGEGDSGGRLRRLKELSGVNLGMELREVAVAVGPSGQWVVLVGGLFPKSGLIQALGKLADETVTRTKCVHDTVRLTCDSGLVVAQAPDGVLVMGSDAVTVEQALQKSTWAEQHALLSDAPVAFAAVTPGASEQPAVRAAARLAGAGWVDDLSGITGSVVLQDPLEVEVALLGVPASSTGLVAQTLQRVQALAALAPGPDWAGERTVLARTKVEEKDGRPILRALWARSDLDRGVRSLADWLAPLLNPL